MKKLIGVLAVFLVASAASAQQAIKIPDWAKPAPAAPAAPAAPPAIAAPPAVALRPVAAPAVTPVCCPACPAAAASQPTSAATTKLDQGYAQEWWQLLLKYGMDVLFSLLAVVVAGAVRAFGKKYNLEAEAAKVNQVLEVGIGYAEQCAIKAAKLDGKQTSGAEKLEVALKKIAETATEVKLKERTTEWWTNRIEAKLGATSCGVAKGSA